MASTGGVKNLKKWYRGFVQGKTRIALAWIFAALLVFSARTYPTLPGIVICFIGASIRFWASGYLRKDKYPAVGGPYSFTRNPLYLGTFLMAAGTAAAVQAWILMTAMSLIFIAIYHYIILDEETKLQKIFGKPYRHYCERVNRFFPNLVPASRKEKLGINPDPTQLGFSWELAMKNKAYEAYLSFAGLIGFVSILAFLWQTYGQNLSF